MSSNQWRESYRTHDGHIDAQHISLFNMSAAFADAVERGEGERVLYGVLFSLLEYTRTHFADEEALLRRIAYPELEKQVSEHKEFVLTVRKWLDSPSLIDPQQVLTAIEQWLVVHISRSDAAYIPYVLLDKTRVKKS